jgi:Tfp pilus assembly protein PilN
MIRINLLPADLRRGTRLPAKVLGAAFGSALAVSASIGWFGLVWFGELGDAEHRLEEATATLADRQQKVVYVDALDTNKKDYSARVQAIQAIGKSRRVWSKFLDEFLDVVTNNGDTERHLAWFTSINVKSDAKKGASVTLQCSLQGDEQDRLANFHEDLKASPFGKEIGVSDPQWKLEEDEGRVPPAALRFPLTLQFAAPVEDKPKPAPKAPATK